MHLTRRLLSEATQQGVLSVDQAEALWRFLEERSTGQPGFRPAHILYYLGGLVAIGALSLFVTLAWDAWAGLPMLLLALCFSAVGVALAHRFLARGLSVPAGIAVTFAVSTTPLAVYSLQHLLGFWQGETHVADFHVYIDWRWIFMELATLAAAAIALWRYRMPFTLFVVGVIFWYLSMDLVPFLSGSDDYQWHLRELVSLYMGLLALLLAFWVDVRSSGERDYAFWLYLFGVAMFWGGLSLQESDSEFNKFLYLLINLALLAVGALLMRRVFAVFAACGMMGYLFHLSRLFEYSLLFPVLLAAAGLGIIFLGIQWQRHEPQIHALLLGLLPRPLQSLIRRVHGAAEA